MSARQGNSPPGAAQAPSFQLRGATAGHAIGRRRRGERAGLFTEAPALGDFVDTRLHRSGADGKKGGGEQMAQMHGGVV